MQFVPLVRCSRTLCLLSGAVLAASACTEEEDSEPGPPPPTPVRVAEVATATLEETVRGIGTLEARETVQIRAERPGRVEAVRFRDGQRVEAGALLFILESDELEGRLHALEANLRAARARAENASRSFSRRESLYRDRAVSEAAFDDAATRAEEATAEVRRVQAELDRVRAQLEDTRIRAPAPGTLGERRVDPGDYARVGELLVTLYGSDVLEVVFTLPERFSGRLRPGRPAEVRVPSVTDRPIEGVLAYVSPSADERTRDVEVKVRIEGDARSGLRPGLFAETRVVIASRADRPVIPAEALVGERTGFSVFEVVEGVARRRDVKVGLRRPGRVEIRSGVDPGDTVVREGHMRLADGDPVKPVAEPKAQAGADAGPREAPL